MTANRTSDTLSPTFSTARLFRSFGKIFKLQHLEEEG